jgi:carbon-monoxide dehydrogenase medium subunit
MRLRLAAPALLVDLRRIPGLSGVHRENGHWRIGAMTRHADVQDRGDLAAYAAVAHGIADQQVRNRGTVGGSLAHGDPASDWPTALLAAEGSVTATGPRGTAGDPGLRAVPGLPHDVGGAQEVVTEVRLPALDGWGWGYEKFTRRAEDWAMVGVLALVRARATARWRRADRADQHGLDAAARARRRGEPARAAARRGRDRGGREPRGEGTSPPADRNASADYKRHLARC